MNLSSVFPIASSFTQSPSGMCPEKLGDYTKFFSFRASVRSEVAERGAFTRGGRRLGNVPDVAWSCYLKVLPGDVISGSHWKPHGTMGAFWLPTHFASSRVAARPDGIPSEDAPC